MNSEIMQKVTQTLLNRRIVTTTTKQIFSEQHLSKLPMDTATGGPAIRPLPPNSPFDVALISTYITTVLQQFDKQNSYGILAEVEHYGRPSIPTILFGLPGMILEGVIFPPTPYKLPVMAYDDCVIFTNGLQRAWKQSPVQEVEQLRLVACSVGLEGSLDGAGSFGGFLQRNGTPGELFGITAGHCVSTGLIGDPICSPSTFEVTSRFRHLLRYTTLSPTDDQLRINLDKEVEVQSLVQRYKFENSSSGVSFYNPDKQDEINTGVLSGGTLGHLVAAHFGPHGDLLYQYDQELQHRGLPDFSASASWLTRIDWAIFTCDWARHGGNVYEGHVVSEIGDLYPGAEVEKMGRTTGGTSGTVSGAMLQYWDRGAPTYEIAIIVPEDTVFADTGDSGACVVVEENGVYKAAGILIGKTRREGITLATPLRLILRTAQDYEWA